MSDDGERSGRSGGIEGFDDAPCSNAAVAA